MSQLGISDIGIICALGSGKTQVAENLFRAHSPGLSCEANWLPDRPVYVAKVTEPLSPLSKAFSSFDCRNNQLLKAAADQITDHIQQLKSEIKSDRIAVILGSSTSGILEGELALEAKAQSGSMPQHFNYRQQEIGTSALFLKQYLGLSGLAYTVSTACSSSAKVFACAQRLIDAGLCDAAIVGGADSLCRLTVNGFTALESVSKGVCDPSGENRDGITIGEGAALFIVSKNPAAVELAGTGESSDAHHISAPHPEGNGAEAAMRAALQDAKIEAQQINYLNMHGTATPKNDAMESLAVDRVFGTRLPCSSTKALVGHSLGAAGALEAAFLWLTLNSEFNPANTLPPHVYSGNRDTSLPQLHLVEKNENRTGELNFAMSNSFAFGGSNASVILQRANTAGEVQ